MDSARRHTASALPAPGASGERRPRAGRSCFARCSAALAVLLLLCLPASAQTLADALGSSPGDPFATPGQGQFLPVEEAYPLAVDVIDDQTLRLVWQMPPGYYLYQHAFRFRVSRDGQSSEPQATLPPALTREDEYFGRVQVYYDQAEVTLSSSDPFPGTDLSVTSQGCADAGLCYPPRTQRFRIDAGGMATELAASSGAPAASSPARPQASITALVSMAALAFMGGLILNLMPCVLPILSMKALSFAGCPAEARHRHGWYYSAGVVTSFLAVAATLILLRGAGQAVGWGFQLQSPAFVISLGYLFTLMGLGLSGLLNLGAGFMGRGESFTEGGGHRGSFFTGVLAVVVASPCTAPFMGAALGFALTQPIAAALTIFTALGIGMAVPMLLLSYSELVRRHLPRPGPWMESLRQVLAFPLYATALWLFWIAGRQVSVDLMAAALFGALLLALALWLWRGGLLSRSVAAACLAVTFSVIFWRPVDSGAVPDRLPAGSIAYSPQRLGQLLARGDPVFVDVTADWCITCLANEKTVLARASVQQAFKTNGVTYMVADWTDYDPQIAEFVASHGRSGIPLYVLYDGQGGSAPRLLPQLLRTRVVLDALQSVTPGKDQIAQARQTGR